jgi:Carboxypeptidase regulatory-like domain
VTFEGQDITNAPVDFKPGTNGKLAVTLTRRSSEVSGQVRTAQGRPGSALVIAFGEDRALWTPHATTTKSASAGEKGDYKITGLRPGRYLLIAVPPGLRPWMVFEERPEAWEALAKQATLVTIGDQERKTLDLNLVSELDR